eukprot:scaffold23884_cov26-Tisochrysis_lutea.AAC.1
MEWTGTLEDCLRSSPPLAHFLILSRVINNIRDAEMSGEAPKPPPVSLPPPTLSYFISLPPSLLLMMARCL